MVVLEFEKNGIKMISLWKCANFPFLWIWLIVNLKKIENIEVKFSPGETEKMHLFIWPEKILFVV